MSRETDRFHIAVVGVVLLTVVAAALTGAATAQTDSPTVRVASATVESGESATVDVVLMSAPEGLAGYAVDLTVEGDGVTIKGASYPDAFGLSSTPDIDDDGRSATLEAADIDGQIRPGDTDVVLATVDLHGDTASEATLSVEPRQFDADGGASMSPASAAGTVTVTADGETVSDAETSAADSAAADSG